MSCANLTEPEEGGEKVVSLEPCDHSVSGDGGGIHAKDSQDDTDQGSKAKKGGKQDDKDHDVVATNICGDRQEDHGDKDNAGGHHGNGVEYTGKEVNCPEGKNMLKLLLQGKKW